MSEVYSELNMARQLISCENAGHPVREVDASFGDINSGKFYCECGCLQLYLRAAPRMNPDTLWAGKRIPGLARKLADGSRGSDFYNSESDVKIAMHDRGLIFNEPGLDSDIERNRKDNESRADKRLDGAVDQAMNAFRDTGEING